MIYKNRFKIVVVCLSFFVFLSKSLGHAKFDSLEAIEIIDTYLTEKIKEKKGNEKMKLINRIITKVAFMETKIKDEDNRFILRLIVKVAESKLVVLSEFSHEEEEYMFSSAPIYGSEQENIMGSIDQARSSLFNLINKYREDKLLKPLTYNQKLEDAAQSHASYIARTGDISHDGEIGFQKRIDSFGYAEKKYTMISENLSYGIAEPSSILNARIDSPGHNVNLLDNQAEEIGIGLIMKDGNEKIFTLVANFGAQ